MLLVRSGNSLRTNERKKMCSFATLKDLIKWLVYPYDLNHIRFWKLYLALSMSFHIFILRENYHNKIAYKKHSKFVFKFNGISMAEFCFQT